MTGLVLPRRRFLQGMATLFAAPAIVRASSLMPVRSFKGYPMPDYHTWSGEFAWPPQPSERVMTLSDFDATFPMGTIMNVENMHRLAQDVMREHLEYMR